jgi:hypothetical protein
MKHWTADNMSASTSRKEDTAMANQDAGRAEVIPSLEGAEGPERGGECMDATEAGRDDADDTKRLDLAYELLVELGLRRRARLAKAALQSEEEVSPRAIEERS